MLDGGHFFRTQDDGGNWEKIPIPQPRRETWSNEQHITMLLPHHLIRSADGGFSWDTLLQSADETRFVLHEGSRIYIYANSPMERFYCSENDGQDWQIYPAGEFEYPFGGFVLHKGDIYGFDAESLIKSTDYGQTWSKIVLPPSYYSPFYNGISIGEVLLSAGLSSATSVSVYRSADNALNWEPAATGIHAGSGEMHVIEGELYAAGSTGLFKIQPGGLNWEGIPLNFSPLTYHPASFFDFIKTGGNWLIIDRSDLWVSTNNGASWQKSIKPSFGYPNSFILSGEKVITKGGSFAPGINTYLISADYGLSFTPFQSLQPQSAVQVRALDVDRGDLFVLGSDKKIYRSSDAADSWSLYAAPSIIDSLGDLFFGSKLFVRDSSVFVFSDVFQLAKMILSKDAGQTWEYFPPGPTGFPWGTRSFEDVLLVGDKLVASTESGFYISKNKGTDWKAWNEGFPYRNVYDLELYDGHLWAATYRAGVWKRSLGEVGSEIPVYKAARPSPLLISPNPASNATQISTGGEPGELRLFDALGRVALRQTLGETGVVLSLAGLEQGVYQAVFIGEKTARQGTLVLQR